MTDFELRDLEQAVERAERRLRRHREEYNRRGRFPDRPPEKALERRMQNDQLWLELLAGCRLLLRERKERALAVRW